jgi:hypothetical protein
LDAFLDTDRVEMTPVGGASFDEIGFGPSTGIISIAGVPFADATFSDFEYLGGNLPSGHILELFFRQLMFNDGGSSIPGLGFNPGLPTDCVWPAPTPPTVGCKLDDGPTVPAGTMISSLFFHGVYGSSLNTQDHSVFVTATVTEFQVTQSQVPEGGSTALFLILALLPVAFLWRRYKRSLS